MSEWTDGDRFWGGIALYQAGKATVLVFTGGKSPASWLKLAAAMVRQSRINF
jgi:hypothetical protein